MDFIIILMLLLLLIVCDVTIVTIVTALVVHSSVEVAGELVQVIIGSLAYHLGCRL